MLPPATCDWQVSGEELLLNELPPTDLLLFVDRGLSPCVYSHVRKVDVDLLQLLGICESLGLRLPLVCKEEV